jgi:hypothetical protein
MDRKREEAGRMVRHKTLRIRQALTARSGDVFTERSKPVNPRRAQMQGLRA